MGTDFREAYSVLGRVDYSTCIPLISPTLAQSLLLFGLQLHDRLPWLQCQTICFPFWTHCIVQFFIHSVQCQPDKIHEVGWHRLAIVTQRGRFYGFVICRFLGGMPRLLFWRHSQVNKRPDCAISIAWRYRHNRSDLTVLAILQAKSDQEMSNSSHVSYSLAS